MSAAARFDLDGTGLHWATAKEVRPREKEALGCRRPRARLAQHEAMTARDQLQVRVNDELVLDAGTWISLTRDDAHSRQERPERNSQG